MSARHLLGPLCKLVVALQQRRPVIVIILPHEEASSPVGINSSRRAMDYYCHHIPGRLRIRIPALKQDRSASAAVRQAVADLPGALSVEVSPVTGSLTVHYEVGAFEPKRVLELLAESVPLDRARLPAGAARPDTPDNAWRLAGTTALRGGAVVVRTAATVLMEKLLERSTASLIAALI